MKTAELLAKSKQQKLQFQDVLDHIANQYAYTPSSFANGDLKNAQEENQGSAKVLYFAQLNKLSQADTLLLFAEHYQNVLDNPTAENHQNIRQFMQHGWTGVVFEQRVLADK